MANAWYKKGKEKFANGEISWGSDDIKAVGVDTTTSPTYTFDDDADEYLSVIPAALRLATSANLASKTYALGVLDAADTDLVAVPAGEVVRAVVVYKDSGDPATSPLLLYLDTGAGLPFTGTGANAHVQWDNGANKMGVL